MTCAPEPSALREARREERGCEKREREVKEGGESRGKLYNFCMHMWDGWILQDASGHGSSHVSFSHSVFMTVVIDTRHHTK